MEYFLLGLKFFVTCGCFVEHAHPGTCRGQKRGRIPWDWSQKWVWTLVPATTGTDILLTDVPSALKRGPRYRRHPTNTCIKNLKI